MFQMGIAAEAKGMGLISCGVMVLLQQEELCVLPRFLSGLRVVCWAATALWPKVVKHLLIWRMSIVPQQAGGKKYLLLCPLSHVTCSFMTVLEEQLPSVVTRSNYCLSRRGMWKGFSDKCRLRRNRSCSVGYGWDFWQGMGSLCNCCLSGVVPERCLIGACTELLVLEWTHEYFV